MSGSMESMDFNANCDFFTLAEEKFDFDVSLSPASFKGDEDEDEVFVGPISHKERGITVGLETRCKDSVSNGDLSVGEEQSWSPLTGEKFEEICKEAQQLACELEGNQPHPNNGGTKGSPTDDKDKNKSEDFVQDTGSKLGIFSKPTSGVLSPVKRETFCVQDSPMKQLPAAFQKRLLRANGHAISGGVACAAKARVGSVSTSSPVRGPKSQTQPKMVLRGRASLAGTRGVLPSKPAAPIGTIQTRPAPEKTTRLPPPRKSTLGSKRSLASCDSSRMGSSRVGSSEDLLSDTASVASDVSDSSLNSSLQGRRSLAPPKKAGPRVLAGTKGPPPQNRRGPEGKRNTSSSSSSVSSFNSSLSVSPTGKAKLNSSLNTSVGGPSGLIRTSVSRLANPGAGAKPRLLSSRAPEAPPPPRSSAAGGRRSISAQGRRPSEVVRSTPIKRPEAGHSVGASTPVFQTPAKRAMERTSSVPNIPSSSSAKPESVVRANSKLKLFLAPTPTSQLKGLRMSEAVSSPEASRIMRPKTLVSACSMDSLPPLSQPAAPVPEPPQTPSTGGNKTLQFKMRQPSALATPMNRRVSGIPMMTPKSVSRLGRPSLTGAKLTASSHWSPVQLKETRQQQQQEVVETGVPEEEPACPADEAQVPLFFLGNEPEAQPPPAVPQAETQETPSTVSEVNQDPAEPSNEDQQEGPNAREESQTPEVKEDLLQPSGVERQETNEVLLVDAPVPVLRLQEKLLIDLSNTPELTRTASTKSSGGQLIDLTSPLIKWSPETGKENHINDAPLINLSF
ncbi:G2 and S phase-expressed protein 1 [Hypomesus transpacificus]|uniref:G2 and S phase-expressed protein 1 n=1 Tax=Hypomesus transpacificus TaxID=137520 RepID=UPI001F0862D1|nr:G2 and S phase-expressed protein 1 [Hypomesus transpacificus]